MKWIIFLAFVVVAVCDVAPPVGIYKQSSELNPDGSYQWSFEAENGITAEESGRQTNSKEPGTEAQGRYQYTAPDGTPVIVDYIANEDGFQPQGNLLPTPPPIPPAIARALDWIAAHPEPENQS